jgi:hypothetical protein
MHIYICIYTYIHIYTYTYRLQEKGSIYVPVFLPYDALQVLDVTLDVYTSLCVIFELVDEEIEVYICICMYVYMYVYVCIHKYM